MLVDAGAWVVVALHAVAVALALITRVVLVLVSMDIKHVIALDVHKLRTAHRLVITIREVNGGR